MNQNDVQLSEVLFEFSSQGNYVKVVAVDPGLAFAPAQERPSWPCVHKAPSHQGPEEEAVEHQQEDGQLPRRKARKEQVPPLE